MKQIADALKDGAAMLTLREKKPRRTRRLSETYQPPLKGHALEPLLTYQQLATELCLPVRRVRELVYDGTLPCLRIGHKTVKFLRSEVLKALMAREVKGNGK